MAFPIDDDTFCAQLLGSDEPVDARAAYERFAAQRVTRRPWQGYAAGFALAAAVLVAALFLTPLGTYARGFLTIFEAKQFAPIDVSSLPTSHAIALNLSDFGTLRAPNMHVSAIPEWRDVDAAAGYHVLVPSYLPAHLPPSSGYRIAGATTNTFTFSARKARDAEARLGHRLPPVPRDLDGSTVSAQMGTIAERFWGAAKDEPTLAVMQMPAPIVRSNGATLAQLERYLLGMPGISPELAVQIRAIGNPASTLPVPFRADKQSVQHVNVNGAPGIAIGDETGVGAAVMWQTHGMLHVVGGALPESEVLKVADGLH
ncbi:MAG: hypothetical protein KGN02_14190 [bacterium]|nr:hypothetical protein [bacterium]